MSGLLLGFVLLLLPGTAIAQAIDVPAMINADRNAPKTFASLQYGHLFEADVDDNSDISRDNAILGVGHRVDFGDEWNLLMMGTYTLQSYDFSEAGNYRWDDVHRGVLMGLVGYQPNDRWNFFGGPMVRYWGESGAHVADSSTVGAITGFSYATSDTLKLGLMVGVFSNIEDGPSLLPVPTVDWKFAEDWKFHLGLVSVVDPGVGVEITYQASKNLLLSAGASLQNRRYRLDDRSGLSDNGVGQERSLPIFAMIRWKASQRFMLEALGGISVAGQLRVESRTGNRIAEDDYDPAGFLGLKAQMMF
jgi:hypothetical protein